MNAIFLRNLDPSKPGASFCRLGRLARDRADAHAADQVGAEQRHARQAARRAGPGARPRGAAGRQGHADAGGAARGAPAARRGHDRGRPFRRGRLCQALCQALQ